MTKRTTFKIIVDVLMMAALLLLMTYNLIGDAFHEWVGTGMLALFILHHILNRKWLGAVFRGKYPPYRILQTSLVLLVFLAMLGSMVSGILLSRYVFSFLPVGGGVSFARTLHLVCGYWNLVLMSLHLGLHWNMMLNMGKRLCKKPSVVRAWALRVLGIAIAVCGAVLFWQEGIPGYLFLQT